MARSRMDMGEASLRCRTYGHAWDEFSRPDLPTTAGWRLSLLCTRCGTERHDVIDLLGQLSERRYVYPEGYRADFDDHRWTLPEFRQSLYARFRSRTTTAAKGAA